MAFIRSAPAAACVVEALTTRLGYLREVAFGRVRNIRVDPTHDSVTFTSRAVKPHIDASNYIWPIEVQFLHCIANDAGGGDSWIVDGAAVAEQLKQENPAAYHTPTRVKVSYRVGADAFDVRHTAPVIERDQDGNLRFVRFSNAQRRILSVAHNDVEPFYAAYHRLSQIVNDPANQIHGALYYLLKPRYLYLSGDRWRVGKAELGSRKNNSALLYPSVVFFDLRY